MSREMVPDFLLNTFPSALQGMPKNSTEFKETETRVAFHFFRLIVNLSPAFCF